MEEGTASWYGPGFHGRKTANGERFNTNDYTAAHKSLPFNTLLRVTNLENGRYTIVRVNDRGPYARGRIIDLSYAAKNEIGMSGLARVRIEVVKGKETDNTSEDISLLTLFEDAITKDSRVFLEYKDHTGNLDNPKYNTGDEFRKVLNSFKKVKVIVDNNNSILNGISGSSLNGNRLQYVDLTDKVNTFNGFSILVNEFGNESDAENLIRKLESRYNDVLLVEVVNNDSVNFKVYVGYYDDKSDADLDAMGIIEMNMNAKVIKILS
ncbi:MAG: septal ring lytic transglycosylase RlpA family protein [Bacteroidetes bacterium]|nr:septal ring lytic transglycosylase RlpA family protein [Bacteroidota bacterium]